MADFTWTVPCNSHSWFLISESERYPRSDDFRFGDRYGIDMRFRTGGDRGLDLEAQLAKVSRAGNVALISHKDILGFTRKGSGAFTVAAPVGLANSVTVSNTIGGTIEVGDYFAVNNECHICTRRVVGSATPSERQLTLEFEPNLRAPLRANNVIELDDPTYRFKVPAVTSSAGGRISIAKNDYVKRSSETTYRWLREVRLVLEEVY